MTLRELRLWHWRKAIINRDYAMVEEHRKRTHDAKKANALANFHIKAVQALNDVVTGTAERDAELEDQAIKRG